MKVYLAALHKKQSSEILFDENANLVENLLMQIQEGDIKPRANSVTEGEKEKVRRKSRKFMHQILSDQNRERTLVSVAQ